MSEIRVDTFKAEDGISAPSFPNGIQVTGVVTATVLDSTVPFLNVGSNIQLGNAGVVTATSFSGTTGTFGDFVDIGSNIKLGNAGVVTATTFTGTTGTFSGNVSIGGTLTYEDVTNIDSVGLITARSGLVSPYADIDDFISVGSNIHLGNAGVCTATTFSGSGASLTNLNGSNIASGTVPTARLGSGTASSSTFLRGDSTFAVVDTALVADTSPQLGGNLDVNTKNINFGDSGSASDDRLTFGAGTDLSIYHNGTHNYIDTLSNKLHLRVASSENGIVINSNGSTELYNDNSKKFETLSDGAFINDNFLGVNVATRSGSPATRNAFLALGDSDTGMAQNNDGQLEAWANNQEIMNFSTNDITSYKSIIPVTNNAHTLGSNSNRWSNIYTNDLHLSNEGSKNEVDGTWGNYTIQEGESDLFLINKRSGKKYKFNLTEVS